MRISAYIPCYNVERYIEATIQALLDQTLPPDELLIIDDGSKDRTVEIASKYPVRIIRHETNKGLAAGRNTAFANARCEFVAAMDADAVVERDWLERLSEAFTDPAVAGSGGRLIEQYRNTPADEWRALHLGQDLGEQRIDIVWPTPKRLGGFGSLYRKDAVEKVGAYNERYRTNYEDVDLCIRLLRAGYKLIFDPRARSHHMRRDTTSSVIRTAWRWDFYLHYYNGGYNSIPLKVLMNFRAARVKMMQHIASGKRSLVPIDLLMPWAHSYWDLKYGFSKDRLPRVEADETAIAMYLPRPLRALRRKAP
jgi:GT2 family glycosyltransferase